MGVWRWTKSSGGAASQGVRANAGSDSSQTNNNNKALSGSATDGSGGYSYVWSVVTQPSGVSSASITSATSASATLTGISATVNGTYVCRLTVTDSAGFTSTDRVAVDVQVAAAGGWTDLVNMTFAGMSNQSLTDGQENTIGSDVFWLDGLSATGTAAIVNGSGLEFSFPNQGGSFAVLLFKGTGVAKVNGSWPRFRVAAAWDNIVYSQNSDAVGLWACGMPYAGTQKVPLLKYQYKRNSASAFVLKSAVRKGTLNASGSDVTHADVQTNEADSMVMDCQEGASGMWQFRYTEGTTTIYAPGSGTNAGSGIMAQGSFATDGSTYWDEGANNSGPYLGIMLRSNSDGSQAAVLKQLIIQQFL